MTTEPTATLRPSAYAVLGLDPTNILTRANLARALKEKQQYLEDTCADAQQQQQLKLLAYEAYIEILAEKAAKADKNREFQELLDQEYASPAYQDLQKAKHSPSTLMISDQPSEGCYVLKKGTLNDVERMFAHWMTEQGLTKEMGFSAKRVDKGVLVISGPKEGEHAGKLLGFFQRLHNEGYIDAPALSSAAAFKPPVPTFTASRKKPEEPPTIRSPFRPPNPGDGPELVPGKK